jgi:hypothetical protein
MLRTNLSTRPFYNERLVHAVATALALIVLAVTIWQVTRVIGLSRYKTELTSTIKRDRAEAETHTAQAQEIRRGLDQPKLAALAGAAKEANDLIAQRTFSWTALFNQLESTLPGDVMLMGVQPEIADGVTLLHMEVQGKGEDDIEAFWERLEKTGAFRDVEWSNVSITEQGLHRMTMNVIYTPKAPAARPAGAPPAEKSGAGAGGQP